MEDRADTTPSPMAYISRTFEDEENLRDFAMKLRNLVLMTRDGDREE